MKTAVKNKTKARTTTTKHKIHTEFFCPTCGGIGLYKIGGRPPKGLEGVTRWKCPSCECGTTNPSTVEFIPGEFIDVASERMTLEPEEASPGGTNLLLPHKEKEQLLLSGSSNTEEPEPNPLKEEEGYFALEATEEPNELEPRGLSVERGEESVILREKGKQNWVEMAFLQITLYGGYVEQQLEKLQEVIEGLKPHMNFGWLHKSQTITASKDSQYGSRLTFRTFVGQFSEHPIVSRVSQYLGEGTYAPNPDKPEQIVILTGEEVIIKGEGGRETRAPWKGSYAALLFSYGREVFSALSGKTNKLW